MSFHPVRRWLLSILDRLNPFHQHDLAEWYADLWTTQVKANTEVRERLNAYDLAVTTFVTNADGMYANRNTRAQLILTVPSEDWDRLVSTIQEKPDEAQPPSSSNVVNIPVDDSNTSSR